VKELRGRNQRQRSLEDSFGLSSLCFKTDSLTVQKRRELAIRRKLEAEKNSEKELLNLVNVIQQLQQLWVEPPGVLDTLSSLEVLAERFTSHVKVLATAAESLGALRQENAASTTVNTMQKYVELLAEKHLDIHDELLSAKKILNENNIAIEKPEKTVRTSVIKNRSISMIGSYNSALGNSLVGRSKSVVESKMPETSKASKNKCSFISVISENAENKCKGFDDNENVVDKLDLMRRKKSSKKVSIAENLNCDYSDTNDSDIGDEKFSEKAEQTSAILDGEVKEEAMNIERFFIYVMFFMYNVASFAQVPTLLQITFAIFVIGFYFFVL